MHVHKCSHACVTPFSLHTKSTKREYPKNKGALRSANKNRLKKKRWVDEILRKLPKDTLRTDKGATLTAGHGCNTNMWLLQFVKQVVFLTVNHRRPLPLREVHCTGETIV